MNVVKRKILSGIKAQNLPSLPDSGDVAMAEVSRSGIVLEINRLGQRLLGWNKNDRLSATIASTIKGLPDGSPVRLPIGKEGVYVVGVSRGFDQPYILFGFENKDSRSENPFEDLVDRIPVAFTRTDRSGVIAFANRYARKFFGKDPVGQSLWHEVVLESDQWKLDEALRLLTEQGHASTRIRYVDAGGVQRAAMLYLYVADQSADYIDIAGLDSDGESVPSHISNEAMYRAFVEQSPVATVLLDVNGTIVMENHPLRQLTGEGPDDAWIGHHYTHLDDVDTSLVDKLDEMMTKGVPFSIGDVEYRSTTGAYVLNIRGTPIVREGGEIGGGVVIVEDRTSQKAAEKIIEDSRNEAVESAARKSAFISTMSHELRTPLGAIKGYSDLLLDELRSLNGATNISEDVLEFAATINEKASGVLGLVDNLFDMALIDAGIIKLDSAPVKLAELINRVIHSERTRFDDRGIELRHSLPETTKSVEGDQRRIEQMLIILLENALKFTHEGRVCVNLEYSEETANIAVIDSGIGLDEEYMDRLFKPLSQGDDRLNREYEGAGVGLAMVERVAKEMGGSIRVRNRSEGGSVFTLELPLVDVN